MKRVLITGGTGFVAWWMFHVALNEPPCATYLDGEEYHRKNYWERGDWTHIIHLAPIAPTRVLDYAKKYGCRVLFASSGAVYDGITNYAMQKRAWEKECLDSGADVVIARLFSFIGEKLHRHAIYEFIQDAKRGGPIVIKGDGTSLRTYLYGEDLGHWLWKILLDGNGIYDVGGRTQYSVYEMAEKVARIRPCEIKVEYRPDHPRTCYVPDIRRARSLGCEQTIGVMEALKRTIEND